MTTFLKMHAKIVHQPYSHIHKQVTENDKTQPSITNHLDAYKKEIEKKTHHSINIYFKQRVKLKCLHFLLMKIKIKVKNG